MSDSRGLGELARVLALLNRIRILLGHAVFFFVWALLFAAWFIGLSLLVFTPFAAAMQWATLSVFLVVALGLALHFRLRHLFPPPPPELRARERRLALAPVVFAIAYIALVAATPLLDKVMSEGWLLVLYNTLWYPCLGLMHFLFWLLARRPRIRLSEDPQAQAGLAILATTPLVYLLTALLGTDITMRLPRLGLESSWWSGIIIAPMLAMLLVIIVYLIVALHAVHRAIAVVRGV